MSYWLRARVVCMPAVILECSIAYTAPRFPAAKVEKAEAPKTKAKPKSKQGAKAKAAKAAKQEDDDDDENQKPAKRAKK